METIICPTDFSTCADNALRYANELARQTNARLILLHSIFNLEPAPTLSPYGGAGGMAYAVAVRDPAYEASQQEKLEETLNNLKNQRPNTTTQYETRIKYGLIKDSLWALAKEERADWVVMGTEGAERLDEVFFSTNAANAVEGTSCPLLIVPSKSAYKPIERIVFATDLEGEPYVAVNAVLRLAGMYDAEVDFLHILADKGKGAREEARAEMNKLYKALPYDKVNFYTQATDDIEKGINQFAHKHKADLLVMGHHHRGFWQQLFRKDHARDMAFHTQLPLLILPFKH